MSEHLKVVLDSSFELAEGPIWWEKGNALVWVDILEGDVYAFQETSDLPQIWHLPSAVGCVVESSDGQLLAASATGLFDVVSGELLAETPFDGDHLRPNDGKIDPFGNLVYGVMSYPEPVAGNGFLTRFRNGRHELLLGGLEIPNGIVWPSPHELLFIDTPNRRVDAYRYFEDKPPELIGTYADLADYAGVPDGMYLDDDGSLLVAMWDGAQILKINKNRLITQIALPVERPTSICRKPGTRDFFVTSARGVDGSGGSILAVQL